MKRFSSLTALLLLSSPVLAFEPIVTKERQKLQRPSPEASFGTAVVANDTWMAVGAPGDSSQGPGVGAVLVFKREDNAWIFKARLIAPQLQGDKKPVDCGRHLALQQEQLLVACPTPGRVYEWNLTQVDDSKPPPPPVSTFPKDTQSPMPGLGSAVAVEGDTMVLLHSLPSASSDKLLIVRKSGDGWKEAKSFSAPAPKGSLLLTKDCIVAGFDTVDDNAGVVQIWDRQSVPPFKLVSTLTASKVQLTTQSPRWGASLAAMQHQSGDVLLVGAPGANRVLAIPSSSGKWSPSEVKPIASNTTLPGFGSALAWDPTNNELGVLSGYDPTSRRLRVYKIDSDLNGVESKGSTLGLDLGLPLIGPQSLAFSGGAFHAGAPGLGVNGGRVISLRSENSGLAVQEKTFAPPGAKGDLFGTSIARHENWLMVGSPGSGLEIPNQGLVSFFRRTDADSPWEPALQFDASSLFGTNEQDAKLGSTVVMKGDWAFASAPGSGKVFYWHKKQSSWQPFGQVLGYKAGDQDNNDGFGASIAFDGTTLAVGAPRAMINGKQSGKVYLYTLDSVGNSPTQVATLTCLKEHCGDHMGKNVVVDGNTVVAYAEKADQSGQIHIFKQTDGSWSLLRSLEEPKDSGAQMAVPGRYFGLGMALDSNKGVAFIANSPDQGSSAIYRYETNEWGTPTRMGPPEESLVFWPTLRLQGELLAVRQVDATNNGTVLFYKETDKNWTPWASFVSTIPNLIEAGTAIEFDEKTFLVGAPANDKNKIAGTVVIHDWPLENGQPCETNNECLHGQCINKTCGGTGSCKQQCVPGGGCSFPDSMTVCDLACEDNSKQSVSRCNGEGNCNKSETVECAPFVCGLEGCKTSCNRDEDCIFPATCQDSECVGPSGEGGMSGSSGQAGEAGTGGAGKPGFPDLWQDGGGGEPGGAAGAGGSGTSGQGGEGGMYQRPAAPPLAATQRPEDEGGCGCRAAGAPVQGGGALAALGVLGALVQRRRRR
jgi:MYXO-CTERM domain-containing protein